MLRKGIDQKNVFLWQQLTELHQLFDGLQNILCSEFPKKGWRTRRRWRKPANGKPFTFQSNSININEFKCRPFMQCAKVLFNTKFKNNTKLKENYTMLRKLIQSLKKKKKKKLRKE